MAEKTILSEGKWLYGCVAISKVEVEGIEGVLGNVLAMQLYQVS